MQKTDVVAYYGSQAAVARALRLTKGAVSNWPDKIPRWRAYQLDALTGGALKFLPSDYPEGNENQSAERVA